MLRGKWGEDGNSLSFSLFKVVIECFRFETVPLTIENKRTLCVDGFSENNWAYGSRFKKVQLVYPSLLESLSLVFNISLSVF